MNLKAILHQTTPFLILCPLVALLMIYYLFAIWREGGTTIMLLPQVLVFLFVAVLFFYLDRIALRNWAQQPLILVELLVLFLLSISVAYKNKTIEVQLSPEVSYFNVVSPIAAEKATELKSIFPFSRRIFIEENNQTIFLSEEMRKSYHFKVKTKTPYTSTGEIHAMEGKDYKVELYSLRYETAEADSEMEWRKAMVLKEIEVRRGDF